jgi:hypothetical protein
MGIRNVPGAIYRSDEYHHQNEDRLKMSKENVQIAWMNGKANCRQRPDLVQGRACLHRFHFLERTW